MRQIILAQTLDMDTMITFLLWSLIINAILAGAVIFLLLRAEQKKTDVAKPVHSEQSPQGDNDSK